MHALFFREEIKLIIVSNNIDNYLSNNLIRKIVNGKIYFIEVVGGMLNQADLIAHGLVEGFS